MPIIYQNSPNSRCQGKKGQSTQTKELEPKPLIAETNHEDSDVLPNTPASSNASAESRHNFQACIIM